MTKGTVLIANGKVSKTDYVKKIIDSNDFFISIDAKLENLKELGVKPNLILGDLDSTVISDLDSQTEVVELLNQNKTDLEKSLDYCIENNIKKVFRYLEQFKNLHLLGRSAQFKYLHTHDLFKDANNQIEKIIH